MRCTRTQFSATIAYDNCTYKVLMTGTVAPGRLGVRHRQVQPGTGLTFTMAPGSFASVLHYVAPIKSDQIQRHDATFNSSSRRWRGWADQDDRQGARRRLGRAA